MLVLVHVGVFKIQKLKVTITQYIWLRVVFNILKRYVVLWGLELGVS